MKIIYKNFSCLLVTLWAPYLFASLVQSPRHTDSRAGEASRAAALAAAKESEAQKSAVQSTLDETFTEAEQALHHGTAKKRPRPLSSYGAYHSLISPPPLPTSVAISEEQVERLRIKQERMQKEQMLNKVERQLKLEFTGWNTHIDRLMSIARSYIFLPEATDRPVVVPLLGFPGYGKTSLVQKWVNLLKWGNRHTQIDLKEGDLLIPADSVIEFGTLEGGDIEEVDQVIHVEEVQRLAKLKTLENEARKGTYGASKKLVEWKENYFEKWWNILGNGTYKETSRKPEEVLSDLQGVIRELRDLHDKRAEQAKKKNDLQEASSKEDVSESVVQDLKQAEEELRKTETSIDQKNERAKDFLKYLKKNFPILTKTLPVEQDEDKIQCLINNPVFFQVMEDKVKSIPKSKTRHFKRTIILITGNIDELIKQVFSHFPQGEVIDPDELHDKSKELITEDALNAFFEEIFGDTPGLKSRFNAKEWTFLHPFNRAQWFELVHNQIKILGDMVSEYFLREGTNVNFEFHESTIQALYREGVSPREGPRVLKEVIDKHLQDFLYTLGRSFREDTSPSTLLIVFDSTNCKFVGFKDHKEVGQKLVVFDRRTERPKEITPPTLSEQLSLLKQAALLLGGTITFESMPDLLKASSNDPMEIISENWSAPDLRCLSHEKKSFLLWPIPYLFEQTFGMDFILADQKTSEEGVAVDPQMHYREEFSRRLNDFGQLVKTKYDLGLSPEQVLRSTCYGQFQRNEIDQMLINFQSTEESIKAVMHQKLVQFLVHFKPMIDDMARTLFYKKMISLNDMKNLFEKHQRLTGHLSAEILAKIFQKPYSVEDYYCDAFSGEAFLAPLGLVVPPASGGGASAAAAAAGEVLSQ